MDEQEHGFDQIVPTAEQSFRFVTLLWRALRYGSLQDVDGNSPIGPATNVGNDPDVFWGVPRFVPGFILRTMARGLPIVTSATIAEFQQRLVGESEGYFVVDGDSQIETIQDPSHRTIIYLKCILQLSTQPEGAIQRSVYIFSRVKTRNLNGSEIHFSVERIFLYWC